MIRAKRNLLSSTYTFFDENETIGVLKVSLFKPTAHFTGKEGDFTFFREKQFEGEYFLSSMGHSYIAQAYKPNGVGLKYIIDFDQNEYSVKPGDLFYDRMYLHYELQKDGELLGTLVRDLKPLKYLVEIKLNLPPVVQIFIFWLALSAWSGERGWGVAWCYR